jgi:hypothetical protein
MLHPIDFRELNILIEGSGEECPIVMLNLLRLSPNHGRDKYFKEYIPSFREVAAELAVDGISPIWIGEVKGLLAGPEVEKWDAALLVSYPSIAAFRKIAESDLYLSRAAPLREAALLEWRLIPQVKMSPVL